MATNGFTYIWLPYLHKNPIIYTVISHTNNTIIFDGSFDEELPCERIMGIGDGTATIYFLITITSVTTDSNSHCILTYTLTKEIQSQEEIVYYVHVIKHQRMYDEF